MSTSNIELPPISEQEIKFLNVFGARVHNLKDISLSIPRNKLTVITGLSGSGKSSLAFDTIFAEGQRRYMETFTAYARQFLGTMERPDVDQISGLSPVISIEQKTTNRNPRSTVGTITEIYDFLRLLYARTAEAYSYVTGKKMVQYSEKAIIKNIEEKFKGQKIAVLAPLVRGRKGHYRELFEQTRKQGYLKVRVDGEYVEVSPKLKLDRYKIHDIELVVDRMKVDKSNTQRLRKAIEKALQMGKDLLFVDDFSDSAPSVYSKALMCPESGISYETPSPNTFSFNSPYGACPTCSGLGTIRQANLELIIPDPNVTIEKGGIAPLGKYKNNYTYKTIVQILDGAGLTVKNKVSELPKKILDIILDGTKGERIKINLNKKGGKTYNIKYDGVIPTLYSTFGEASSDALRRWAEAYMTKQACTECNGYRLKKESQHFKIANKHIGEISELDIDDLDKWLSQAAKHQTEQQKIIAAEVIKELKERVGFLLAVGLNYLSLNRPTRSLSGGESQRIRLASQIGSQLMGITYILDEPSIGLHQRDNHRLIDSLKTLTHIGNTVIVVEHDKDIMLACDYIIDLGPRAGEHGGTIVSQGSPKKMLKHKSLTMQYLNGQMKIEVPRERRKGNGKKIILKGASGNNLKNVDLTIPLGTLCCVTGVSGSGKSTLINETLYPILNKRIYKAVKVPMPFKSIKGLEHIDKVIEIDQAPIGRSPRSNPATYVGFFTEIRNLFASLKESKIRGYKIGRFSFNVQGGRCEHCKGAGIETIEMNFLPNVQVECPICRGNRYNRETLQIKYNGHNINEVLEMTVERAAEFFQNIPKIHRYLKTLLDVGLGYIKVGQPATTLSGGEAQRIKLSSELAKRDTGKTIYILDEPTTGLHFEDIRVLLNVINKLVIKGNTVVIIEHNMDVIKVADHVIDLGPEGGKNGGRIVAVGTPEQIAIKHKESFTGEYLRAELGD